MANNNNNKRQISATTSAIINCQVNQEYKSTRDRERERVVVLARLDARAINHSRSLGHAHCPTRGLSPTWAFP